MLQRKDYEKRESETLAPCAMLSQKSLGREFPEDECEFRSSFQRDRDRIVHSEAFRRLEYKTQVFVNHEGDYYRTRLTHTLEVAQISRGIARSLRLNEDLAEAISLAHDLGHTPFGHSGEATMNRMMKNFGGFEHNRQSYRVVTLLEYRYPEFTGLNLSYEVLEGIAKHASEFDRPSIGSFTKQGYPTIEAQIVNIADEIAYLNHDLDDGLKSGLIKIKQLSGIGLWNKIFREVKKLYPDVPEKIWIYQVVRRLIHLFVSDVQMEIGNRIASENIKTIEDVRHKGKNLADFSEGLKGEVGKLRKFLFVNLYKHKRVEEMAETAQKIVEDLFKKYRDDPKLLSQSFRCKVEKDYILERHICDYIAGMTDRFAMSEFDRLNRHNG